MNIYDKIKKGQEEQVEIIKSVLGETTEDMIEKAKKANIGDIHIWGGKKYKKQPNGKWLEVSESHGLTKKEHESNSNVAKILVNAGNIEGGKNFTRAKEHEEAASKLSDKEHTDEEVGIGEGKSDFTTLDRSEKFALLKKAAKGMGKSVYSKSENVFTVGYEDPIVFDLKNKLFWVSPYADNPGEKQLKNFENLGFKQRSKHTDLPEYVKYRNEIEADNNKRFGYLNEDLNKGSEVDIQKGKPAISGEIRTWGGKKYKKLPNGKWAEISEHGMTKEEHRIAKVESTRTQGRHNPGGYEDTKKHREAADKLSDKEYDESELEDGEKKEGNKKENKFNEEVKKVVNASFNLRPEQHLETAKKLRIEAKKLKLDLASGKYGQGATANTKLRELEHRAKVHEAAYNERIKELEGANKKGEGKDIKKSLSAIEIINQNDVIEKSHIMNDFAYSDQFSVSKKGKELKQKFAEAILDEVREIKQYMAELKVLMVEIGELPIVPAGERQYYKVDGYEGKLAEMPNFYDVDEWLKGDESELSQKKIKYNNIANKVIDCSIEMVLLNTFIRNLDDNKEYKLNATQASKIGF